MDCYNLQNLPNRIARLGDRNLNLMAEFYPLESASG